MREISNELGRLKVRIVTIEILSHMFLHVFYPYVKKLLHVDIKKIAIKFIVISLILCIFLISFYCIVTINIKGYFPGDFILLIIATPYSATTGERLSIIISRRDNIFSHG